MYISDRKDGTPVGGLIEGRYIYICRNFAKVQVNFEKWGGLIFVIFWGFFNSRQCFGPQILLIRSWAKSLLRFFNSTQCFVDPRKKSFEIDVNKILGPGGSPRGGKFQLMVCSGFGVFWGLENGVRTYGVRRRGLKGIFRQTFRIFGWVFHFL